MNNPFVSRAQSAGGSSPAPQPGPAAPGPGSSPNASQGNSPSGPAPPTKPAYSSSSNAPPEAKRLSDEMVNKIDNAAKRSSVIKLSALVVVLAVVAIGGYLAYSHYASTITTTTALTTTSATTAPTTTVKAVIEQLSSCSTITSPGTYYLTSSISAGIQSGSCINIESSNVKLVGNGNRVQGNGPYVSSPPFSYGVFVGQVSNVTVTGIIASKFSYNFYFNGAKTSYLTNSSSRNATISGIYLNNTYDDYLVGDNSSGTSYSGGGINFNGGSGTVVDDDIVQNNAYYGMYVNSSGDSFSGDSYINNPIDLACVGKNGLSSSSSFSASYCSINQECNFARCSQTNIPFNISTIALRGSVGSCGTIASSGTYSLSGSLNVLDYINTSSQSPLASRCINIATSNVRLDCNGYSIDNGGYGVYASSPTGLYNITVTGCTFSNDTYGLGINHAFEVNVSRISAISDGTGIILQNVTTGVVASSYVRSSREGIVLNGTSGITLTGINSNNNTYGTEVLGPGPNIYSNDTFASNKAADLACSSNAYKSTTQTLQGITCGTTTCSWGANYCKVYLPPQQNVRPLTSCFTITAPGNYSISKNIVSSQPGSCFVFKASGVNLYCNGNTVYGATGAEAFTATGVSNVIVSNCSIADFGTGIAISNSNGIVLKNLDITNSTVPVRLDVGSHDLVSNVVATYSQQGLNFTDVSNSSISNDTVRYGLGGYPGFNFTGASRDVILFNTALENSGYGFSFTGSRNNLISNNTGSSNKPDDYYCSQDSSGLYANSGGINVGLDKVGCKWLVAVPVSTYTPSCEGLNTVSHITLTTDLLYTYGGTCYTVFSNAGTSGSGTVINCAGHTIYATHGGTFVKVINATNVEVENCVFRNFTTPVVSTASYTKVINNTFGNANASVSLYNAQNQEVLNNNILNSSYGVFAQKVSFETVSDNNMSNTGIGIYLVNDTQGRIENNTASGSVGMYMVNSNRDQVYGNRFVNDSTNGVVCAMTAQGVTSGNEDLGNNECSSNSNCQWMTMSTACRV